MGLADKLYDWLAQGPTPVCDRTLAAALAHAEPSYFDRIVQVLLKRAALASPASMLLSPANLAAAAEGALRRTPDPELRQRLDRLSLKLFGVPLSDIRAARAKER